MGGSDSLRELCVQHNSKTTHRASLQQKLFVLDYIRKNNVTLSKAVKHFINIGCSFKISVSTVSDWKVKEDKLRALVESNAFVPNSGMSLSNNSNNNSILLSRRAITTFKYPLIVRSLEAIVRSYITNNEVVNETLLKQLWKQVAKRYQETYQLSDEFIDKGPTKGFIYRFKARNGLGHHQQKMNEDITNEKENLKRTEDDESEDDEEDDEDDMQNIIQPSMINHDSNNNDLMMNYDNNSNENIEYYIFRISQYLSKNKQGLKYSNESFTTFMKFYQQERNQIKLSLPHLQQQSQLNKRSAALPPLPEELRLLLPNGHFDR